MAAEECATVEMCYQREIRALVSAEEYRAAADKKREMQAALARVEARAASS